MIISYVVYYVMAIVLLFTLAVSWWYFVEQLKKAASSVILYSAALIGVLFGLLQVKEGLDAAPEWSSSTTWREDAQPWWWQCWIEYCEQPGLREYLTLWGSAIAIGAVAFVIAGWLMSLPAYVFHVLHDESSFRRETRSELAAIKSGVRAIESQLDGPHKLD